MKAPLVERAEKHPGIMTGTNLNFDLSGAAKTACDGGVF